MLTKPGRLALAISMVVMVTAAATSRALGNCTQGAVHPIFQAVGSGGGGYFGPPPAGSGAASAVWWQLGYGNRQISEALGVINPDQGTGTAAGIFTGNDSGLFGVILTPADSIFLNPPAPPGSLTLNYENSWGSYGVDGCADNPRTTSASDNDNILNRYFDDRGPGYEEYYSTTYLIDYPIGFLVTEGANRFFALAFVANHPRGTTQLERVNDMGEGVFQLGDVVNGEPNAVFPGLNNVIPWQPIPRQRVDAITRLDPGAGEASDRLVALSWTAPVLYSDASVRPSARMLDNPGNGVGVLDQGPLFRYVLETAPVTSSGQDPSTLVWSFAQETLSTSAILTVPPDSTAIRMRTVFGKKPTAPFVSLADCRVGRCGDIGYEVVGAMTFIAGPLVSEQVVDLAAVKNKGAVQVTFRTTSELTLEAISVLAISGKGEHVVANVAPVEGNTGAGAEYAVELASGDLKGAKQIAVRLDGPGGSLIHRSDPLSIR